MSGIFKFKQFDVDQSGCAMKINTDGVLLGALAEADEPESILDIGTGTGVIALMLAQRFSNAKIDAVEIDEPAAEAARKNFASAPFSERLTVYPIGFEDFFNQNPDKKYDLIISNPPFYINSLKSAQKGRQLAKHADGSFFDNLIGYVSTHLQSNGVFSLILPVDTAKLIISSAAKHNLFPQKIINICSFLQSAPHRMILSLGVSQTRIEESGLVIYKAVNEYSEEYAKLLQPYFIAF